MSDVKKIVANKLFREQEFHTDYDKLSKLFKGVNEMKIGTDLFKCIRILLKFFRFSALPLFRPIYSRIEKNKTKYLMDNHAELTKTAAHVRAIIKNRVFPSLAFYFKAGCDAEIPYDLFTEEHNTAFVKVVGEIDGLISNSNYGSMAEEKKQLDELESRIVKLIKERDLIIEKLCLQFYLDILRERKNDVQRELSLQKPTIISTFQRPKGQIVRIEANKGQIRELHDSQAASDYLCCRSYFYLNEIIEEPQTIIQQYKNYQYPYNNYLAQKLTKTICGFLNGRGGIIYIGIYQNVDTKKRLVKGDRYSESVKESLQTYFRIMCQKVYPQIVHCQMYKVEFVPIKDGHTNVWLPGMFLVRIKVQIGSQGELYSYKRDDEEVFAFRTENEVLTKRIGQEILGVYRQKLLNPVTGQPEYLNHPGPCRPVEMGKQIFEYEDASRSIPLPWNNRKPKQYYVEKGQGRSNSRGSNLPDLQPHKKPFIVWKRCCEMALFQTQAQSLKNGWLMISPSDFKSFTKLQEILIGQNNLDKVNIISLLVKVSQPDIRAVYKELENSKILFTTLCDDLFLMNSPEQAIQSMEVMLSLGANFQFQLQTHQ